MADLLRVFFGKLFPKIGALVDHSRGAPPVEPLGRGRPRDPNERPRNSQLSRGRADLGREEPFGDGHSDPPGNHDRAHNAEVGAYVDHTAPEALELSDYALHEHRAFGKLGNPYTD